MQNPTKANGREPGSLNHPDTAEWMAYLYGELPRTTESRLKGHLQDCLACRRQVQAWHRTKKSLNDWKLKPKVVRGRFEVSRPAFKWALAALLMLGLGYGIGRFSTPKIDMVSLRADLEKPLRESLTAQIQNEVTQQLQSDFRAALNEPSAVDTDFRRELRAGLDLWANRASNAATLEDQRLLAEVVATYRANRQQDQQRFVTLLDRADKKIQAEHLNLRRALETVAVVAADRLQRTESELGQLASYTQAQYAPEVTNEASNPKGN